jgi:hypothetical protein
MSNQKVGVIIQVHMHAGNRMKVLEPDYQMIKPQPVSANPILPAAPACSMTPGRLPGGCWAVPASESNCDPSSNK